ncbi:SIR2-like domain-containing protein [Chitinophaga ginsengisegetis]|uniref:SIR2-like domain-containing protein n=1 Tax=Chitinophaga ginsengisegetis TaxID=393003 RepID=A0A1T5P7T3_9BACT|nr:SIR2 family protein [Chitinophaga ginsengisegetis]SKD08448.1 SIR2-like domain-containing protein [Chitinophaga ginsengisegetis]
MKEKLFELIRKGEVILWAGAGFSMYAGYPSGENFKKIIYNDLSDEQKLQLNSIESYTLDVLSQEYQSLHLGSINPLIHLATEAYKRKPISTKNHDILAKLPFIKTIITTNYDELFENAYGEKGQLILNDKQVPYIDKSKTQIFKIHGDLSNPDSIVLTKDQYLEFLKNRRDNLIWKVLNERMATKSILFIGYTLEDLNIKLKFDEIFEPLGKNMPPSYFIIPSLPSHKILELSKRNIQFIPSSGEDFIEALEQSVKKNLIADFEKNIIAPEDFREICKDNNLQPRLVGTEKGYVLSGLSGANGDAKGSMAFSFDKKHPFKNILTDVLNRKNLKPIVFPTELMKEVSMTIEGFSLPIEGLMLQAIPDLERNIDLYFSNGFEIFDLRAKIYGVEGNLVTILNYENYGLQIEATPMLNGEVNFKINTQHPDKIKNLNTLIKFHELLNAIIGGNKMTIRSNGLLLSSILLPAVIDEGIKLYLNKCKDLKRIESHFQFRLIDFDIKVLNDHLDLVGDIISFIDQTPLNVGAAEMTFDIKRNSPIIIEKASTNTIGDAIAHSGYETVVNFMGNDLAIGYRKIIINDAYVPNITEALKVDGPLAILRSRTDSAIQYYTKTPPTAPVGIE